MSIASRVGKLLFRSIGLDTILAAASALLLWGLRQVPEEGVEDKGRQCGAEASEWLNDLAGSGNWEPNEAKVQALLSRFMAGLHEGLDADDPR